MEKKTLIKFRYPCLYFKMMRFLKIWTDFLKTMLLFMKVQPFAGIIDSVKWGVPRVLFNMHAVGPFKYQRRAQDFISPGNSVSLEIRVICITLVIQVHHILWKHFLWLPNFVHFFFKFDEMYM